MPYKDKEKQREAQRKWEKERVDGRSAPSTLSLPKSASAGGLRLGFPWARYYDLAHGNPISDTDTSRWFGGVKPRPRCTAEDASRTG